MTAALWIIAGILVVWFYLRLDRPRRERQRAEKKAEGESQRRMRREYDEELRCLLFGWALGTNDKPQPVKTKEEVIRLINDRDAAVAFLRTRLDDPKQAEGEYDRFLSQLEMCQDAALQGTLPIYLLGLWACDTVKDRDRIEHLQKDFGLTREQAEVTYDRFLQLMP